MRIMMATAVFLSGCLHAQGSGRSAAKDTAAGPRTFDVRINDEGALHEDRDGYAIRQAAAAGWDWVKTSRFIEGFFTYNDCANGVKAVLAFKLRPEEAVGFIERAHCEDVVIDSRGWNLPVEYADVFFFAAVRGGKFNFALELLPLGTHGENGQVFLFQAAVRHDGGALLARALKMHIGYHEAFMAFLWEIGRFRLIANFSLTIYWQRTAFDQLLELGKWDFAAEAAQYGISESFRTEGVLMAFRAAMAAGDFKAGRYLLARYGPTGTSTDLVTQEMYDEEREKWYAAKKPALSSEPRPKRKAKRKLKPCADDDWCP